VERRGSRSVVHTEGHVPYAARSVHSYGTQARVLLVQTIAGPLAGDRFELELELGAGAELELRTNGATLALPVDATAHVALRAQLGEGARLALLPDPVVLAAGCDLVSSSELELAAGAVAVVREVLVLGRYGEEAGRFRSRVRCELAGLPLLHEAVSLGDAASRSPVALAGARVYGSVALLGTEPVPAPTAAELVLAGGGRLARALGMDASETRRQLAPIEAVYLEALIR
jgi:urease accessory protein